MTYWGHQDHAAYIDQWTRQHSVLDTFDPRGQVNIDRNWFPSKYFSGCDCEFIFVNGTSTVDNLSTYLEDDIMDFQFTIQQAHKPIYGYASYLFDRIALGIVIIHGQFAIPFTEKNKLLNAVRTMKDRLKISNLSQPNIQAHALSSKAEVDAAVNEVMKRWEGLTIAEKIKALEGGNLDGTLVNDVIRAGIAKSITQFKDYTDDERGHIDKFYTSSDSDIGMNIVIHYAGADPEAQEGFEYLKDRFGKGKETREAAVARQGESKVLTLKGVFLQSTTQIIRPSGSPALEQYAFIARDVV